MPNQCLQKVQLFIKNLLGLYLAAITSIFFCMTLSVFKVVVEEF